MAEDRLSAVSQCLSQRWRPLWHRRARASDAQPTLQGGSHVEGVPEKNWSIRLTTQQPTSMNRSRAQSVRAHPQRVRNDESTDDNAPPCVSIPPAAGDGLLGVPGPTASRTGPTAVQSELDSDADSESDGSGVSDDEEGSRSPVLDEVSDEDGF